MKLRVLTPTHIAVDAETDKVTAESQSGSFCLLPRHVDYLAVLAPGLLAYLEDGNEQFLAVNGGTLVKCGGEVLVSTTQAIPSKNLSEVRRTVEERFHDLSEREQKARTAMLRIEADFVRRFIELEENA